MEKGRNKRSLALWFSIAVLVSQNIVIPVMCRGFEDEKNYFPSPDPGYGGTPPSISYPSPHSSGGGTPPSSHGGGSSPHGNHGHGGSGGSGNCGNPPSHSNGGGSHTPTPSHNSGGGSHTPTPSHSSGGGSYTPTPSHSSGGGSHTPTTTPSTPSYTPTPTTPSTPSYTPTPTTPSTPSYTPTPTTPTIVPATPSYPGILPPPSPFFPDPSSSPSTGTCSYWRAHPDLIWSLLGWWGSVGSMFKLPSSGTSFPGSSLTIPQALSNTRNDGLGALYREGTASLLNSMANSKFPYTTEEVRDRFISALVSDRAASAQAQLFKQANEGRVQPRA